jgi:hypothetical protein
VCLFDRRCAGVVTVRWASRTYRTRIKGPFRRLEPDSWRMVALLMVVGFVPETLLSLYILLANSFGIGS